MKYEIYSLFRNCNVLGLSRLLNDALLWEESKDKSTLFDYRTAGNMSLYERYFIGNEKVDSDMIPLLGSKETNDEKNEILFYHEDGKRKVFARESHKSRKIYGRFYMPYTTSELVYLKRLLKERLHHLFFTETECEAIEESMNACLNERGVALSEVEQMDDFIVYSGRSRLRDRWEGDIPERSKRIFSEIMKAIKGHDDIVLRLSDNPDCEQRCRPKKLVYSQLEERLRLLAYDYVQQKDVRFYVSDMIDVREVDREVASSMPQQEKMLGLILKVSASKNGAERLLTRLTEYTYYITRDNTSSETDQRFYVLVFFPEVDRLRVIRRIMSVGSNVVVLTKKRRKTSGGKSENEPRNQQLERFLRKYIVDTDCRKDVWANCEATVATIKEELKKSIANYK